MATRLATVAAADRRRRSLTRIIGRRRAELNAGWGEHGRPPAAVGLDGRGAQALRDDRHRHDEATEFLRRISTGEDDRFERTVCDRAIGASRKLAGDRRLPAADYLIAAAAAERGFGLLHYDRHFEPLTACSESRASWSLRAVRSTDE